MIILQGKGVFGAIAMGKLSFYKRKNWDVSRIYIHDVQKEILRFCTAKNKAIEQLQNLYQQALQEVCPENAMIFEAQRMMLADDDLNDFITNMIATQCVNAEYAVDTASTYYSQIFSNMKDPYLQERAMDIADVSQRLQKNLVGAKTSMLISDEPVIIAADDFMPSKIVQLNRDNILAIVMRYGSSYSHTAILTRDMNIPSVIGVEKLGPVHNGLDCIVDGLDGIVYLQPDQDTIRKMTEKKAKEDEKRQFLFLMRGKPNTTVDGRRIDIYANIANLSDVGTALEYDAGGIGLMRTEFLFLGRDGYPSEDTQFRAYRQAVEKMNGKSVLIRTLDIGADKSLRYFEIPSEENPALGCRSIRLSLDRKDVFRTQLRAILRASVYGRVAFLFPMISSLYEMRQIKKTVSEVKEGLRAKGITFDEKIKLGIMIETPAAAIISDILAKEVDFFSIGTNDLIQYALAVDRQNPKMAPYYQPHHPAVMRLIYLTIQNAHKHGIKVGISGDLAADLSLTECFLLMGVDELSVSPSYILGLRQKIRELDLTGRELDQEIIL